MVSPTLSLVVPAFNLGNQLRATLACIEAQSLDGETFECIVVDDGSSDDTVEILRSWRPRFAYQLLENSQNLGRSEARNSGWRSARGDVVVFLDGDMLARPELLDTYRRHFARGGVDVVSGRRCHLDATLLEGPERGALESLLSHGPEPDPAITARWFSSLARVSRLGQLPAEAQERLELELDAVCERYPSSLTRSLSFVTSNVAVTRAALEASGGFSPLFARGEDTELGIRLARAGARFRYAADAQALHLMRERPAVPSSTHEFAMVALCHPYLAVIAWYAWAMGHEAAPSLASIAEAEAGSSFDAKRLLEFASAFGLSGGLSAKAGASTFEHDAISPRVATQEAGLARGDAHIAMKDRAVEALPLALREPKDEATTWNGEYELSIDATRLRIAERECRLNLPLPIADGSGRSRVSLTDWSHPDLMQHVRAGMVLGYVLRERESPRLRFSYRFCCEFGAEATRADSGQPASEFLRPTFPRAMLADLKRLLRVILPSPWPAPERRASLILDWVRQNLEGPSAPLAAYVAAQAGLPQRRRVPALFVNLCQLAGLPARLCCAALLAIGPPDTVTHTVARESPFTHVAEVWLPDQGWSWAAPEGAASDGLSQRASSSRLLAASVFAGRLPTLMVRQGHGFRELDPGLAVVHSLRGGFASRRGR